MTNSVFLFTLIPVLIFLPLWFLIAKRVAKKEKRNNGSPTKWFLIILFGGILGIIVYMTRDTQNVNRNSDEGRTSQNLELPQNQQKRSKRAGITQESGKRAHQLKNDELMYDEETGYRHGTVYEPNMVAKGTTIKVVDGKKEGVFVIDKGDVTPKSGLYENQYGADWMTDIKNFLQKEYTSGYKKKITCDSVLDVFESADIPVLTASEVAENLDCSRPSAYSKLEKLTEQGELDKKKVGENKNIYVQLNTGSSFNFPL